MKLAIPFAAIVYVIAVICIAMVLGPKEDSNQTQVNADARLEKSGALRKASMDQN